MTCEIHGYISTNSSVCPICSNEYYELRKAGKLSPKIPMWSLGIFQDIKMLRVIAEREGCPEDQIRKAIDEYIEEKGELQRRGIEASERWKKEERERVAREKENAYFGV